MATLAIPWNDGSGDVISFSTGSGEGNATITIYTSPNNGIDRTKQVKFKSVDGKVIRTLTITQRGLYEPLKDSNSDILIDVDGETIYAKNQ